MSIPQIIGVIELIICIWYLLAQKRPDTFAFFFAAAPGRKADPGVHHCPGSGVWHWHGPGKTGRVLIFSRISPVRRRKVTLEIWSGFAVREMVL